VSDFARSYRSMGVLRIMLHTLALVFILLLPFAEPARILEGPALFFGGILPATAPLVFVVIMFDVMMCRIMKSDADWERAVQLSFIIRTHLTIGFVLLGLWLLSFRSVLLG